LLKVVDTAIAHLNDSIRTCEINNQEVACSLRYQDVDLGATSLTILALAKYIEITGDHAYLPLAQSLGNWLIFTQDSKGQFTVHRQRYSNDVNDESGPGQSDSDEFISWYYPGQAIWALMSLYKLDSNQEWLAAAEKGAKWIISVRDAEGLAALATKGAAWSLAAFYELNTHLPDSVYHKYALRVADEIIYNQHIFPEIPDWFGGFETPPTLHDVVTRGRALYWAYQFLSDDDIDRKENIRRSLERIAVFIAQQQVIPESALYLPDPEHAMGGFRGELDRAWIRMDNQVISITNLLGLQEINNTSP